MTSSEASSLGLGHNAQNRAGLSETAVPKSKNIKEVQVLMDTMWDAAPQVASLSRTRKGKQTQRGRARASTISKGAISQSIRKVGTTAPRGTAANEGRLQVSPEGAPPKSTVASMERSQTSHW